MHATRRGAPITAPWALALIPLSLGASAYFPYFGVWLTFAPFLPLLGAWLGARYGRAAFGALILAAPLLAPTFSWSLTDSIELGLGAGLETFALTAFAIAAFDRSRAPAAPSAGWLLAPVVVAAAFASASVRVSDYVVGAELAATASSAVPVAAFLLVASGRASALATILSVAAFGLLALAARALLPFPLAFEPSTGDVLRLTLSWGREPLIVIGAAVPAALVGALLSPLWRDSRSLATVPQTRPRAIVALLAAFLLPFALWGGETAYLGLRNAEEAANGAVSVPGRLAEAGRAALTVLDAPASAQEPPPAPEDFDAPSLEEIIVVEGSRIEPQPAAPALPMTMAWLMVLGGIAFAAGAAWPRGAPALLPTLYATLVLAIGAAATAAAVGWTDASQSDPSDTILELLGYVVETLLFLPIVGWGFAWFGARSAEYAAATAQRGTGEGEPKGEPEDEP
jgi:hypothetical protein